MPVGRPSFRDGISSPRDDIESDGRLDGGDIAPFILCLGAGVCPWTERTDFVDMDVLNAIPKSAANPTEIRAALLRGLLDRGITPRKLTEGRSLQTHFLEVAAQQS